jgi:hypothetical protein
MEFKIGDRVVLPRFGTGVIVEIKPDRFYMYLVVVDNKHKALHNNEDENLPLNRCVWSPSEGIVEN